MVLVSRRSGRSIFEFRLRACRLNRSIYLDRENRDSSRMLVAIYLPRHYDVAQVAACS